MSKKKKKFRIDLKWPEIQSKVNFGHPKWPTAAILSKISKENEVTYRSEMARNAIKSEFRTSKMGAGSHLVKNKVAYRSEMARNAIESEFWISKMGAGGHFVKKFQINKNSVLIRMARNAMNFGHPKWPTAAILLKISKKKKFPY